MKTPRLRQSTMLPIGLDLSMTRAMLLQLRRRAAGFAVIDALRAEVSDEPAEHDDLKASLELVFNALRARRSIASFKGRRCVVGLGDDLLRIRSIRQPRMPKDEAERAIVLEAPDRLGFSPEDAVEIGWISAGEVRQSDQLRDEVIVIGVESETLEWLTEQVLELGMRPIAIEPSFVANARCFERVGRRSADESISRVLIDIGSDSTDLIVLRGPSIVFYKSLRVGSRRLNQLVAERLGVEEREAEDLRKQRILSGRRDNDGTRDERTEQAIFEAIRPLLDELAREVSMCLRYYAVSFSGPRPSFVLATGIDACEPRLVDHLQRCVGVPMQIGRPLDGVELGGSLSAAGQAPLAEWSAAVGLSLRLSPVPIDRPGLMELVGPETTTSTSNPGRQAA